MGEVREGTESGKGSGLAASPIPRRTFRRLSGDLDTDVCIIGASVAGLAAGLALARRGWSVAVLEAGEVENGESASALGFVVPGFPQTIDRIVARVGVDSARELWALSAAGAAAVRATVPAASAGVGKPGAGQLILQGRDDAAWAEREVEALRAFGAEAEVWSAARVEAVLPGARRFPAVYRADAFRIHPADYVYGLAAALEEAGGRVFEHAPVTAVDIGGVRKYTQTAQGRVRAAHILLASSESGQIYPPLAGRVLRLFRHVAVTAPLGAAIVVPFAGVVARRLRSAAQFYREDESIVWASPLTTKPRRLWLFARRVAWLLGRLHPELAGAKIAYNWTAVATYALHRMPLVGALAPEVWIADAFGDTPIGNAAMAGDLIARAIAEKDDRWRAFSGYGPAWMGGLPGRWLVSVALPWTRIAAGIAERAGRRRVGAGAHSASTPTSAVPIPEQLPEQPSTDNLGETPAAAPNDPRPKRARGKKEGSRAPETGSGKKNRRQTRRAAQTTKSVTT